MSELKLIREVLTKPSLESGMNREMVEEYRNKREKFEETAREWTKKYATGEVE